MGPEQNFIFELNIALKLKSFFLKPNVGFLNSAVMGTTDCTTCEDMYLRDFM